MITRSKIIGLGFLCIKHPCYFITVYNPFHSTKIFLHLEVGLLQQRYLNTCLTVLYIQSNDEYEADIFASQLLGDNKKDLCDSLDRIETRSKELKKAQSTLLTFM